MVEYSLAKAMVEGSTPFFRLNSLFFLFFWWLGCAAPNFFSQGRNLSPISLESKKISLRDDPLLNTFAIPFQFHPSLACAAPCSEVREDKKAFTY